MSAGAASSAATSLAMIVSSRGASSRPLRSRSFRDVQTPPNRDASKDAHSDCSSAGIRVPFLQTTSVMAPWSVRE